MRPYFAVVQDSFREAIGSPVLWVLLALLTLFLAMLAPIGAREELNTKLDLRDVSDWPELAKRMNAAAQKSTDSPGKRIWERMPADVREKMLTLKPPEPGDFQSAAEFGGTLRKFIDALNAAIEKPDLFDPAAWSSIKLNAEAKELIDQGISKLTAAQRTRLHCVAVENAFGDLIRARPKNSVIFSYAIWDLDPPGPVPMSQARFHKQLAPWIAFLNDWVVGLVLVFAAILVTSPIIPRMFDQGQLHLLLSKPVTRSFLLLSQFLGGCAYVLLLTAYLLGGLWLILGLRLDYWDVQLLWMIPLYGFMFAIYYTVSVAAAVVWRSTLMSIIVSFLFFVSCFSLGFSKVFLEESFLLQQRVTQIVPVDGSVLAIDDRGLVNAWSKEKQGWEITFLPKQFESMGQGLAYLPIQMRSVGPVYVPERKALMAVQYPLTPGTGPLNFGQQIVVVGGAENGWKHTPGSPAPLGTFAIFRESSGRVLALSNVGLYRLAADPLRQSQPTKIFGVTVPGLGNGASSVEVGPKSGLSLRSPTAAAYHAASKTLAIYSAGQLLVLRGEADGKYQILVERQLESTANDLLLLACDAQHVVLAHQDGRVQEMSTNKLADEGEFKPEPKSSPRFLQGSPTGGHFALVYQNGVLWTFDSGTSTWTRPRVTGQRDISAATYDDAGQLLVAEHTSRITTYDPSTLARGERYAPTLDFVQRSYYYGVLPFYTIFPKPGELGKTMKYIVTGKDTIEFVNGRGEGISAAQRQLNPWGPVWSGCAFMMVVLGLTCFYFERQEY